MISLPQDNSCSIKILLELQLLLFVCGY